MQPFEKQLLKDFSGTNMLNNLIKCIFRENLQTQSASLHFIKPTLGLDIPNLKLLTKILPTLLFMLLIIIILLLLNNKCSLDNLFYILYKTI